MTVLVASDRGAPADKTYRRTFPSPRLTELTRAAYSDGAVVTAVFGITGLVPLVGPAIAPALARHPNLEEEPREPLPEPRPSSESTSGRRDDIFHRRADEDRHFRPGRYAGGRAPEEATGAASDLGRRSTTATMPGTTGSTPVR